MYLRSNRQSKPGVYDSYAETMRGIWKQQIQADGLSNKFDMDGDLSNI